MTERSMVVRERKHEDSNIFIVGKRRFIFRLAIIPTLKGDTSKKEHVQNINDTDR